MMIVTTLFEVAKDDCAHWLSARVPFAISGGSQKRVAIMRLFGFKCHAVYCDNQDFPACQSGEVAHKILGRAAPMGPLDNKNGIGYCKGVGLSLWRFA